eukprot:5040246-Prorocentrum_lima.AAC.1
MTSSLVGSEMCIRDRVFTMQDGLCAKVSNSTTYQRDRDNQDMEGHIRICLLYTSDAADDM